MAGLFFCLASAEGAGLLFCSAAIQPYTSVYSVFCVVHATIYRKRRKTVHRALQWLLLWFAPFYRRRYQTDTSGYNTTCTTLERITHARTACTRYQIPPPRRTLYRSTQPPYYNNVYKGAWVQQIADRASPEGSRCFPRLALAWHRVSLALCFLPGTAARNHWRLSPQLFSGFRPITNKGEQ